MGSHHLPKDAKQRQQAWKEVSVPPRTPSIPSELGSCSFEEVSGNLHSCEWFPLAT